MVDQRYWMLVLHRRDPQFVLTAEEMYHVFERFRTTSESCTMLKYSTVVSSAHTPSRAQGKIQDPKAANHSFWNNFPESLGYTNDRDLLRTLICHRQSRAQDYVVRNSVRSVFLDTVIG